VGTSTAAAGGAFLWTPETGMENLGHLHAGLDISLSHALADQCVLGQDGPDGR